MTEIKTNFSNIGQIQIADDVICAIAGTAATEVEGVASTGTTLTTDIVGILSKKNFTKGVKIDITDTNVNIDIGLIIKLGYKINEVAFEVQQRVQSAIETMTGLCVGKINITIISIAFEKEKKDHN